MLYFLRIGRNVRAPHFLQQIFPERIFAMGACITVLHPLQTNLLRNNLASASGNLTKMITFPILAKLKNA